MPTARRRAETPEAAVALGARLRRVRHSRGLTLVQLGAHTGLSHAFLSQVERGHASPSMSTLHTIAGALDIPVAVLLSETAHGTVTIVRSGEGSRVPIGSSSDDVVARALTRENHLLKVSEFTGHFPLSQVFAHGGEEHVYVVKGRLAVTIGSESHELGPSDAITFDCTLPHSYLGLTDDLHFLLVVADPGEFASPLDESTVSARRAASSS